MVEIFWPEETSPGGGNPCAGMTAGSPAHIQCLIEQAPSESLSDTPRATPAKSGPEELAIMEATAEQAHEEYYAYGGTGYGTTPGGPDVYYSGFVAPYEQGTFFGVDLPGKNDLLLYGALAIGALALLKR
jgi:hypothetical protein